MADVVLPKGCYKELVGQDQLVECSVHHRSRQVRYCDAQKIYNAERKVVGFKYVCRPESECHLNGTPASEVMMMNAAAQATTSNPTADARERRAKRAREDSLDISGSSGSDDEEEEDVDEDTIEIHQRGPAPLTFALGGIADGNKAPTADSLHAAMGVAFSAGPKKTTTQRQSARYYDISQMNKVDGDGSGAPRKTCWACGMDTHEKPNCPNILCRSCHRKREDMHHMCRPVPFSPFVILQKNFSAEDLEGVQCVFCGKEGHLDCSNPPTLTYRTESCCFCGGSGHSAYDCRRRQAQFPDRWAQRVAEAAAQLHHEAMESGGAAAELFSRYGTQSEKAGTPSQPSPAVSAGRFPPTPVHSRYADDRGDRRSAFSGRSEAGGSSYRSTPTSATGSDRFSPSGSSRRANHSHSLEDSGRRVDRNPSHHQHHHRDKEDTHHHSSHSDRNAPKDRNSRRRPRHEAHSSDDDTMQF